MSTPIRLIAKNALSPNIYKSPNSQHFFKSPTLINKPKLLRPSKLPKSLTFSNIKLENCNDKKEDTGVLLNELDLDRNLLIKSPNHKNDLKVPKRKVLPLINTPERKEILKNGLISNLNWNILGRGTFGTVFQALYKDKKVATKLIKNKPATILRESNAIKLNHKNIIQILRVTNDENYNYAMIVMQHCSQNDLQELLNNNQIEISINLIAKWALNICEALIYCHENGVLHLDVKPKNILVQNNDCILCDFGNSLDLNDETQKEFYLEQIKTEFCGGGSVIYTAPELFCTSKNDHFNLPTFAADVYSFGITMWQMENRKLPYDKMDNVHCIIYAVVKNGLRPQLLNKKNYEKLQDLYVSCWNSVPEKRLNLLNVKDKLLQIINENN